MALSAQVYTIAPNTIKGWFKQRLRWNVGGIQCVNHYKKDFLKKNMLGVFIIPFFVIAWVLAITGLLVLSYRIFRTVVIRYLSTKLSIFAQTAILTMDDIYLTPSILFFFGIVLPRSLRHCLIMSEDTRISSSLISVFSIMSPLSPITISKSMRL